MPHADTETVEQELGRFETRRYRGTAQLDSFRHQRKEWADPTRVGRVEAEHTVDGETSRGVRYFISSQPAMTHRRLPRPCADTGP